ncbi:hypothetical protein QAD02_014658 [Eretmocerus hayati]|uniref:Uncharacterized protein n=1 Tax=Eretmocerus hayati TaxID=131215 RepID=A0ACC2P754_9HYME|nr:hypothetical protein QAD02_014658 [Eretmocerus hayati]
MNASLRLAAKSAERGTFDEAFLKRCESAVVLVCTLAVLADKDGAKNRDKRQHSLHQSRRSGRPPPYAVQMEPIAHYSQRDPLYNPLTADAKSDDQQGFYGESPYNYYPTEPEPIIEIIIKESNESLPTPVPPPLPPAQKKKEPIQVFYVKYEKKQEYGEDKPRVVYDTPIPALTPVEEHEEIKPDNVEPQEYAESTHQVTPSPPPEPSTTLRTIIRPDSEQYHSGSSGIRVTFNTEQIPPNNHNKRSDKDAPTELIPSKPAVLPPGAPKRAHGPFAPIQSIPPRSSSGFPQQRVLNSFSQPLGPFQGPGSFQPGPPPDFSFSPPFIQQPPSPVRGHFQSIPPNQRSQQRHPITIQGLPEVQQRLPVRQHPSPQQTTQSQQQSTFQNQQSFFLQNLPPPQQQRPQQEFQQTQGPSLSVWSRPVFQGKNANSNQKIYATPQTKTEDGSRKYSASTPNSIRYSASTPRPTAPTPTQPPPTPLTTTTTPSPRHEAKVKQNIASLPDEVPDDIREQLLSSGILGNADIQILDYDKVGGINIGDLPPEALANFYGAGGAAATGAASEPVPRIAKPKTVEAPAELQIASSSSNLVSGRARITDEVMRPGGVEMKVVHFDPKTEQGQRIAESHINENATRVRPVVVGPETQTPGQYNRYLPLKVSGASFPIPNVPELNGKKISSVVVLAPVDQNSQSGQDKDDLSSGSRYSRKIAGDVQAIKFLAGDSLKQLVKKPSADNYKRWLEQERQTEPQRQSVVLLVTSPREQSPEAGADKEIFMYDVTSESVSKLAGDLSSAFVDAAESNADVDEDTSAAEH